MAGLFAGKIELFLIPREQSRALQGPIRPAPLWPRWTPDKALGRVCRVRPSAERKRPAWPRGDRPRPVTDGHGLTGPKRAMACFAETADDGPCRGTGRAAQPGHQPSRGNRAGIPAGDLLAPAQAGFFPRQPRRDAAGAPRLRLLRRGRSCRVPLWNKWAGPRGSLRPFLASTWLFLVPAYPFWLFRLRV
jgi:hypothetical protein